ncbi:MAG: hydrogenase iron-sulfur subunit [Candidatus Auribacterota bacterium]|nr:hydrogenase iron-sulfur subunit [Candidatus Auribacterota bacterium]
MKEDFEPRMVGFLCHWCSYHAADLAGTSRMKYQPNIKSVKVMCSSRVDPMFVIKAFMLGADGVMVAGCHPGDCHYQEGNYHARRRFAVINKIFEKLGLETERLKLAWISASEGQKFAKITDDFVNDVKKIGPNKTTQEVFL